MNPPGMTRSCAAVLLWLAELKTWVLGSGPKLLYLLLIFAINSVLALGPSIPALAEESSGFVPVQAEYEQQKVKSISFFTSLNLDYQDLSSSVTLKPGMELSLDKVRESEQQLLQRKVFSRVQSMVKSSEGGLELRFMLEPLVFVSRVEFSGAAKLDDRQLQRLAAVRYDMPLDAAMLSAAQERLKRGYAAQGYRRVAIKTSSEMLSGSPNLAAVKFEIEEGRLAKISKVSLAGNLPKELESLPKNFERNWLGKSASEARLRRMRVQLLLALRNEGYLRASVEHPGLSEAEESGDVQVLFNITPREPVSIVFTGNAIFSANELMELLKLETRTVPLNTGAIKRLRHEVRKFYQEHGYYFTKVRTQYLGEKQGKQSYRIVVQESAQYRLKRIEFKGNHSISGSQLRQKMESQPSGFWLLQRWQPGFLVNERVKHDLLVIKDYYENQGYEGTKVEREVLVDEKKRQLTLVVFIKEAPRQLVRSVQLEWVEHLGRDDVRLAPEPAPELKDIVPAIALGSPLSTELINIERNNLRSRVQELGYPNVVVEAQRNEDTGELRFLVDPGPKICIGRVVLQGNSYTHDYVISRELSFVQGDTWKSSRILRSQEELYRLRIFRSVSIEPLDGSLDEPVEDVAVRILEQDTASLELRGSLNTEDGLHLGAEMAQRDLFGNGTSIIAGADGYAKYGSGDLSGVNGRLAYLYPRLLGAKIDLSLEGFVQSSNQLIEQYSYDRLGLAGMFHYRVAEHTKGSLGWTAYNERLFDLEPGVVIGPNDQGTTYYSMLKTNLDFDWRDNPYNPRSGHRTLLDANFSDIALGSQVDFASFGGQESIYVPLGNEWVWSNNMRFRFAAPFGQSPVVPLSSRFFLGGRESLRGYSPNSIGPRREDLAVFGGDLSVNGSSELQYALSENLRSVIFLDLGQAMLRKKGDFTGDPLNLSDMRYSPGVGLRYQTPIGPISADVGFATDRQFGENWGRVNVGIGNTF